MTTLRSELLIDIVDLTDEHGNDMGANTVRIRKPKPRLPDQSVKLELPKSDELEERAAELVAHWGLS